MMRRGVAWLLALPIVAGGLSGGHELAWRVAVPDAAERARELAHSGNRYPEHVSLVLGVCLAAVLVAFALRAYTAFVGERCRSVSPTALAVLPSLAFVLREQIERLGAGGDLFPGVLADKTFLIGLAVQVPLGLVLLFVARALDALAASVGVAIAGLRLRRVVRALEVGFARHSAPAPTIPVLARGYAERGPPRIR